MWRSCMQFRFLCVSVIWHGFCVVKVKWTLLRLPSPRALSLQILLFMVSWLCPLLVSIAISIQNPRQDLYGNLFLPYFYMCGAVPYWDENDCRLFSITSFNPRTLRYSSGTPSLTSGMFYLFDLGCLSLSAASSWLGTCLWALSLQ